MNDDLPAGGETASRSDGIVAGARRPANRSPLPMDRRSTPQLQHRNAPPKRRPTSCSGRADDNGVAKDRRRNPPSRTTSSTRSPTAAPARPRLSIAKPVRGTPAAKANSKRPPTPRSRKWTTATRTIPLLTAPGDTKGPELKATTQPTSAPDRSGRHSSCQGPQENVERRPRRCLQRMKPSADLGR